MTKLADCEITHRHIRGQNVVFLFGPSELSAEMRAALLQEYRDAYGPGIAPAYVSPEGWQTLNDAPQPKLAPARKAASQKAES
jgi:hypothetical protein